MKLELSFVIHCQGIRSKYFTIWIGFIFM